MHIAVILFQWLHSLYLRLDLFYVLPEVWVRCQEEFCWPLVEEFMLMNDVLAKILAKMWPGKLSCSQADGYWNTTQCPYLVPRMQKSPSPRHSLWTFSAGGNGTFTLIWICPVVVWYLPCLKHACSLMLKTQVRHRLFENWNKSDNPSKHFRKLKTGNLTH